MNLRILLAYFFPLFPGLLTIGAQQPDPATLAKFTLLSEATAVKPGDVARIGLRVEVAEHWHLHWKASGGEAGLPTEVEWQVPEGVTIGDLRFPVPQRYDYQGFIIYVHEGVFHLLATLTLDEDFEAGAPLEIQASVSGLVCDEELCLPRNEELALKLPVADVTAYDDSVRVAFDRAREAWPKAPPKEVTFSAAVSPLGLSLKATHPSLVGHDPGELYFFSAADLVAPSAKQTFTEEEDGFRLDLARAEYPEGNPDTLQGVLTAEKGFPGGAKAWALDLPRSPETNYGSADGNLTAATVVASAPANEGYSSLWAWLGLVLAAMAAWIYGRWGGLAKPKPVRRKAMAAGLALMAGGTWLGYPTEPEASEFLTWEAWSPERESELLEAGKAVYVDFTAKWCLSCQVNKRVFHYEDVMEKVRELDLILLKADWTDKGPVILEKLESYGRAGVPLNVYHKASEAEGARAAPILMPEFLTEDVVLDVLETGEPYVESGETGFAGLLGFAFLGGLILNLMPCVFPVIGLKIMGFAKQAGEEKGKVARHGVIFAIGVFTSFWLLVGVLLWLRDVMGQNLGWGFQLQEPGFVFALALVLLVFALSLSGVFEIGLSLTGAGSGLAGRAGYAGSFFSGTLAVVVATPCMAPFLGVAVGAALTMDWLGAYAVFTCVAAGLAFPYLLLSLFPGWIGKLPKPGAWMESFKQAMAFPLYGTVVWLLWTFSSLVG